MRKSIKCPNYVGLVLALCVLAVSGCSCSGQKPTPPIPNPLAGWKLCQSQDPKYLDQLIRDDYQSYIQNLSPEEKRNVRSIDFFEDGAGQNSIEIIVGINGRYWRHILVYDKGSKRIKTIKYATGYYAS